MGCSLWPFFSFSWEIGPTLKKLHTLHHVHCRVVIFLLMSKDIKASYNVNDAAYLLEIKFQYVNSWNKLSMNIFHNFCTQK